MPGMLTIFYKIKLVIFVLSAQNDCFLLMDETVRSRPKLIRMRQQNTNFATKYKHYFFYNRQKKDILY
jgi:hypothetical protein